VLTTIIIKTCIEHRKRKRQQNLTEGFTEVSVSVSDVACGRLFILMELSTTSIQAQARLTSVPSFTISC